MNLAKDLLTLRDISLILSGIFTGTLARFITLKIDYRQVPSYPNGYFINILVGFISAALGAVAIPALMVKDFTAITFLALAIQHFRDIREMEIKSLEKLEHTEYVKRGQAYIDGIGKTYESRNYISLLSSLITVLIMSIIKIKNIYLNAIAGIIVGLLSALFFRHFTKGKTVGDICTVEVGEISVQNSELFVDGLFVTNLLGSDRARELFINEGIALVIKPKKDIFRVTMENFGQRQAILFECIKAFGVKRHKFVRRSFTTGKIIIAFVPIISDIEKLIAVAKFTPILENSRKIHRIMSHD